MNIQTPELAAIKSDTICATVDLPSLRLAVARALVAMRPQSNSSIPILRCLRLTARPTGICVAYHGLDFEFESHAKDEGSGDVMVPGRTLKRLLDGADGDELRLEMQGPRLIGTAGRFGFQLVAMPVADCPTWPDLPDPEASVLFAEGGLAWLVALPRCFTSTEEPATI